LLFVINVNNVLTITRENHVLMLFCTGVGIHACTEHVFSSGIRFVRWLGCVHEKSCCTGRRLLHSVLLHMYHHTTTVLWPFLQDYPGEPVPEVW